MTAKRTTLTPPQIAEILRRLGEGESQVAIAKDFKVTRAAISLIKQRTADPARFAGRYGLKKRLSPAEIATFKGALDNTLPADHGLEFVGHHPAKQWTMKRGYALARKLFDRVPSVRVMKECMAGHLTRRADDWLTPPEPPGPRDIRRLPPELAADKNFVRYYLSPLALQIEQREYEMAMEQYHRHLAKHQEHQQALAAETPPPPEPEDDEWPDEPPPVAVPAAPPPPGHRSGKHAKSKGAPFTKPKRRK
jgi:hypothetical protein